MCVWDRKIFLLAKLWFKYCFFQCKIQELSSWRFLQQSWTWFGFYNHEDTLNLMYHIHPLTCLWHSFCLRFRPTLAVFCICRWGNFRQWHFQHNKFFENLFIKSRGHENFSISWGLFVVSVEQSPCQTPVRFHSDIIRITDLDKFTLECCFWFSRVYHWFGQA